MDEAKARRMADLHQQVIDLGMCPKARRLWKELQTLLAEARASEKRMPGKQGTDLPF